MNHSAGIRLTLPRALNEARQSIVVNPAGDPEEKVLEAAENCPVSAITVKDAETNEVLFP